MFLFFREKKKKNRTQKVYLYGIFRQISQGVPLPNSRGGERGTGKGVHTCQAGYWGDLPLPPPSQVSKLRFGECCGLLNFIQLVNAEDLNPGIPLTSKGCFPETSLEIRGNNMEFCGKLQKQVVFANGLSGKVCSSLGSHTGRVTLTPRERSSQTGVCV